MITEVIGVQSETSFLNDSNMDIKASEENDACKL